MNRRIVPPPQVEIKAAVGAIPADRRVIVEMEFGAPAHELQDVLHQLLFFLKKMMGKRRYTNIGVVHWCRDLYGTRRAEVTMTEMESAKL